MPTGLPSSKDAPVVTCPTCGQEAKATATKYGVRHDCCGQRSWGGRPLATPATHAARRLAHDAFDVLWKHEGWRRSEAYKELAQVLGIERKDCHMELMSEAQALLVPAAVTHMRERRRKR